MAGSKKWLRAMRGQKCEVCDTEMTEYAIKKLTFELLPRQDGPGYAAVKTTMTAYCPGCGNGWSMDVNELKPADMKSGIGWLIERTRKIINPFTKKPIEFDESLPASAGSDGDGCICEFDEEDEEGKADDDDDEDDQNTDGKATTQTTDEPAKPPPKSNKRGRLLTQPSIRGCCPPTPITDRTLEAARRKLRCYSDVRTKPSFQRLMKQFAVRVRKDGQPLGSDDPDE